MSNLEDTSFGDFDVLIDNNMWKVSRRHVKEYLTSHNLALSVLALFTIGESKSCLLSYGFGHSSQ